MLIAVIRVGTVLLNLLYALMKLLPLQKKVVMISRQSNEPSDDFKLIREEILRREPDTRVIMLCHTLDGGLSSAMSSRIRYCFHMLVQMYHMATARFVVLDTYCIVASLLHHRSSLKIMQIWHSMGTMKKFGYSTVDTAEGTRREIADAMRMHRNYDMILASSDAYRDHLAAGFDCDPKKIVIKPLPRLDLLINDPAYEAKTKEAIYRRYPVLKEKPVILYCPTFRKDEEGFPAAAGALAAAIDREQYNLVYSLHPLAKVQLEDNVIRPEGFDSFQMLFVADYVISDYSCIVYEAAVRDIPLFFYDYDIAFYTTGRGLAIDYFKELPGTISEDARVIAGAIDDAYKKGSYDKAALRKYADKYVYRTAHATQDIVDLIIPYIE